MPSPAVTYTFSNSTTADATQVNQNFTDIINGVTDGTKDLSVNAVTANGNLSVSGNTTLGNASSDDVTVTGSLASSIPIKTNNSYDIGSSTLGLRALYLASSSGAFTAKIQGPAIGASITLTLPSVAGTLALGVVPTVQILTSGTAATYTPTSVNVKWIKVRMLGGGGGGAAADTAAGNNGSSGSNTTFDNLTAFGGAGGIWNGAGGSGGAVSVGSGWTDIGSTVGNGGAGWSGGNASANIFSGGQGGAGALGGGSKGDSYAGVGNNGGTNTGSGGAGGGTNNVNNSIPGSGGGAGGYVEAIAAAGSFTYTVGAGGAGGLFGQKAGGTGGAGKIIVEEFYY